MKVETPQLRWHQMASPTSKKDEGHNGPILSCSLLTLNSNVGVLATVGNTEVNLWRVGFTEDAARRPLADAADRKGGNDDDNGAPRNRILVQPQTTNEPAGTAPELAEHTRIEHIVTLSRGTNERSINAVKFAPSGAHLVAAGDGGTVVVFSVPGGDPSFWNRAVQESDLPFKILFNRSDDVMDVAWSADSKRFVVCSLDHTVAVWELGDKDGEWRTVHRSTKDHTHYVQGVACDPKGVYLASMGSDRMVKVYSRKNVKDSAVKGELAKYELEKADNFAEGEGKEQEEKDKKAIVQSKVLPEILTSSNFALQKQVKTMKFLQPAKPKGKESDSSADGKDSAAAAGRISPTPVKRHHMFADELTLGSFFRRLAFTPDGAFLAVPAALWHGSDGNSGAPSSPTSVANAEKLAESSFATYLFARHRYDQPYKVLTGLEKPSVVVRPNPVLFQLPKDAKQSPLPHRSVLAVLTNDSVLIYDTHHDRPLAVAQGLHYAGLTDAAWSNDGKTLFVTSSDGYISILSFANGELGEVHVPPEVKVVEKVGEAGATAASEKAGSTEPSSAADASAGVTINTLAPQKKEKESPEAEGEVKKVKFSAVNEVKQIEARQEPVINTLVGKKKKKKIVPTLVPSAAAPVQQQESSGSEEDGGEAPSAEEKKRSSEEIESPSDNVEETINILLPKKKKKVSGSSTPVATM